MQRNVQRSAHVSLGTDWKDHTSTNGLKMIPGSDQSGYKSHCQDGSGQSCAFLNNAESEYIVSSCTRWSLVKAPAWG